MNIFLQRYKKILGEDYDKLQQVRLRTSIRVNTLKIGKKELLKRLENKNAVLEETGFSDCGYFIKSRFSAGSAPEYLQGYYYIQDAAAQLPAEVLIPSEDDVVLDMAAAPGGKTTQLAQMMKNKGVLVALDKASSRLMALRNNLERMGVANCIAYKMDSRKAEELGVKFDKILLDAPCSGSFIKDRKWFDKKTVEGFAEMANLQKELVKTAVSLLKKNGTLVYSTCSMEPEENEEVIHWALKTLNIKLEKIKLNCGDDCGDEALTGFLGRKYNPEVRKCIRIWPHKTGTQPFFMAKITMLE